MDLFSIVLKFLPMESMTILGRLSNVYSKALVDALGKFQFLAKAAILAGFAFVNGRNAVRVPAIYGVVAIVREECATWTLEVLGRSNSGGILSGLVVAYLPYSSVPLRQ